MGFSRHVCESLGVFKGQNLPLVGNNEWLTQKGIQKSF